MSGLGANWKGWERGGRKGSHISRGTRSRECPRPVAVRPVLQAAGGPPHGAEAAAAGWHSGYQAPPSSLAGSWGGSIPGPAQAGEAEVAEWLDPPRTLSPEPGPAPQLMSSRWIGIGATPTASGPPGPGSAQCGGGYAACQAVTHNGLDAPGPALSFMI